jgi:hypothetical protein
MMIRVRVGAMFFEVSAADIVNSYSCFANTLQGNIKQHEDENAPSGPT